MTQSDDFAKSIAFAWWPFLAIFKMKRKSDHGSKFSNWGNWKEEAWKRSVLQGDSNPWRPRFRVDGRPGDLWSHRLRARSFCLVHIFPCSEMMWNIYEIYICTAVLDESEEWSSQQAINEIILAVFSSRFLHRTTEMCRRNVFRDFLFLILDSEWCFWKVCCVLKEVFLTCFWNF